MRNIDWSNFEAYVEKVMKEENIAGAAVAVSKHGEIIYENGFGVRNIKSQEPTTPETIFGTASITKSFTAMAIMKLEEEGKLSVQDPVTKYLPEFMIPGVEDMECIKIHHLLSHTTGLPPMRRRQDLNQLDEHLSYLSSEEIKLLGKPGEYFSYCNDTFLLLGAIIERLTGRLYRKYITEHILNPLRMYRSTYSLDELGKYDNVSIPYDYKREKSCLEEASWPQLGNYEVGGGVRSTVLDLLKYGQVYVTDPEEINPPVISKDQVSKMWQHVHPIGRNTSYCYALQVTPNYHSAFTLVEHGGGQPGVSSNFGFVPEEGLVIAVLCNVSAVPSGDIWLAAVNTALNLPLEEKRSIEPSYEATIEELRRFEGRYTSAEGGNITIFLDGDNPKVKSDDQELALRASDQQTLVIMKNEKPIRFFFDEKRLPWAAQFGVRMLTIEK